MADEFSKSLADEGNNLGFSGYHDSLVLKKKDSTRILGSEMTDANQDHKRRCLEKLMVRREPMVNRNVEDVKCALEVEVIDDTALIETTAAVSGFKNRYRNQTDMGFGKSSGIKEENGGKKRNKGFKKQGVRCSMKCLNEKKPNVHVVEDNIASGKQIPEGKGHKAYGKMSAAVKYVYRKKDIKNPKMVDNENVVENQETDVSLKVSVGDEKESETVNEKDDGLKLIPKIDDLIHIESEDENVCASTNVGLKKSAYTRAEMEALRFVDEPGQKTKWAEVYSGFTPSVAREYTGLVVDASNRPTQRYTRVVNCGSGSTRHANANPILSMPPVIPLCSPSYHRKFDRVGSRVSFN